MPPTMRVSLRLFGPIVNTSGEISAPRLNSPKTWSGAVGKLGNCRESYLRYYSSTTARLQKARDPSTPLQEGLFQTVNPTTYYHFFPRSLPYGPPPKGPYRIDLRDLRNEFLKLQAQAHPDLHPPEKRNQAHTLSARINEAYKTLQSPLLRAQYLLSLRGIDVGNDEAAKVDDADLLTQVLEARETVEEAKSEDDIHTLEEVNEQRIQESVRILDEAFSNDDLDTAKSEAVKLRYWTNISEALHSWEKDKPVTLLH